MDAEERKWIFSKGDAVSQLVSNIEYMLKEAGAELDAIKMELHESKLLLKLAKYNAPPPPPYQMRRNWYRYDLYHIPRPIGRVGTPSDSSEDESDDEEDEIGGNNPGATSEEPQ